MNRRLSHFARAGVGVAVGMSASLVVFGGVAFASGTLEDFESDTEGEYPSNWDVIQERIVLGNDSIAGCETQDLAAYDNLDNLEDRWRFLWAPDGYNLPSAGYRDSPTFGSLDSGQTHSDYPYYVPWIAPGDSSQYVVDGLPVWWDTTSGRGDYAFGPDDDTWFFSSAYPLRFDELSESGRVELLTLQAEHLNDRREDPQWSTYEDRFDVMVLDGSGYGIGRDSQVLQLYSWTDAYDGHVIHGPAVASSNVFDIMGAVTVKFWFRASRDMDYYHVYGYLQDVEDCTNQIPILSRTGEFMDWQQISVDKNTVPDGQYRFVFVGGTYDGTWGQLGGARMWIDDIECVDYAGGSCAVVTCESSDSADCDETTEGSGLTTDQIIAIGSEGNSGRAPGWLQDALSRPESETSTLPSTR